MELISILLSVISIWGIAVMTPGPNFFITAQTTVTHSRLAGFYVVLGICTGTILWSITGFFGISYLFITAPWLYLTLKVLGGSYIIYLGILLITNSDKSSAKSNSIPENSQSYFAYWQKGLLTNLSNPKTAMFITSLFVSVLPKDPTIFIGIVVVMLMATISMVWYLCVVLIFSSKRFNSAYGAMQKWITRFVGVVFIGFGAKLILDNR